MARSRLPLKWGNSVVPAVCLLKQINMPAEGIRTKIKWQKKNNNNCWYASTLNGIGLGKIGSIIMNMKKRKTNVLYPDCLFYVGYFIPNHVWQRMNPSRIIDMCEYISLVWHTLSIFLFHSSVFSIHFIHSFGFASVFIYKYISIMIRSRSVSLVLSCCRIFSHLNVFLLRMFCPSGHSRLPIDGI